MSAPLAYPLRYRWVVHAAGYATITVSAVLTRKWSGWWSFVSFLVGYLAGMVVFIGGDELRIWWLGRERRRFRAHTVATTATSSRRR